MSAAAHGVNSDPLTLTRFTIEEQHKFPNARGDLTLLLQSIQLACKVISSAIRKASLINLYGLAGNTNVQGEDVKKLDVLANDLFINTLKFSKMVNILVSEENDEPIVIDNAPGKYSVVFDPLDGSSNIDCGVAVGTIFGVYPYHQGGLEDVLRPGKNMVAAGYTMYGSSTVLVLTTGSGVNGFTLDPELGEFILTHPNIRIPEVGNIYSINEGNVNKWDKVVADWVQEKKTMEKPYSLRYIGSMVADVHRTLLYGGVFMYPRDKKTKAGKLRLLYECYPMAMICEQAGGAATNETDTILAVQPKAIHERQSIFIGSKKDVNDIFNRFQALQ